MSETDPGGVDPVVGEEVFEAELSRVSAEVAAVREELAALRAEQAASIRTRRLVVVDPDGFERVVVAGHGHHGQVTVHGRARAGRSVCVELFANDPIDGTGAHVGLALSDAGDVAAAFEVVEGGQPALWVEREGIGPPAGDG